MFQCFQLMENIIKNETATMFFLKKPSLVIRALSLSCNFIERTILGRFVKLSKW